MIFIDSVVVCVLALPVVLSSQSKQRLRILTFIKLDRPVLIKQQHRPIDQAEKVQALVSFARAEKIPSFLGALHFLFVALRATTFTTLSSNYFLDTIFLLNTP